MTTHLQYQNGHLSLNIYELLSGLTGDALRDLIDGLSCEEQVIANVAEQICGGYTELGSRGGYTLSGTPHTALDKARRKIAEESSAIAREEIERLKRVLASAEELSNEGWRRYHELNNRR
jgi:hypothetical protein